MVHTDNSILLSHKKNEIKPSVATWMDLSKPDSKRNIV